MPLLITEVPSASDGGCLGKIVTIVKWIVIAFIAIVLLGLIVSA